MFMGAGVCFAEPANDEAASSQLKELNATILDINLTSRMIVVAEKDIHLLTKVENNQLVWQTVFNDKSGKSISATSLQVGDRVIVKMKDPDADRLEAESVTFIKSSELVPTKSASPSGQSLPVQLQDGVWKN